MSTSTNGEDGAHPSTGKRKEATESMEKTDKGELEWESHDERLFELGRGRRKSNRLKELSSSAANNRQTSAQAFKRVRGQERPTKRARHSSKAEVSESPPLTTPKLFSEPHQGHQSRPAPKKIHTSKQKAKKCSRLSASPSPQASPHSHLSPSSRIRSPKLSPSARSLLLRDDLVDLGTFLTAPPADFTLDVFEYLTLSDILSASKVCQAWKGFLAPTPVMVDALAFGERYISHSTLSIFAHDLNSLRRQVFTLLQSRERSADFHVGPWHKKQPHITAKMRSVLVDWLEQVNREFENNVDTLFLAIRMVDSFLDRAEMVQRGQVQLVGVGALLIASKLEETHYPDLDELLYLCDSIYSRKELLEMEAKIMCALNHTLHTPSVYVFLKHLLHEFPLVSHDSKSEALCRYLVEQSLLDYAVVQFRPSLLAIAIYAYVCDHFNIYYENALEFSGWSCRQLVTVAVALYNLQREAGFHLEQHIRNRYMSTEAYNVADIQLNLSFVDRLLAKAVTGRVQKSPGGERIHQFS